MKVLIIGAGAAGMMAALSASQDSGNTVTLLERQSRVGRKLMATGNGRCNLTNRKLTPGGYHGSDPGFVLPALSAFGVERTLDFFAGLGLLTVTEESGRVYPLSDQANSVVDVLRFALEQQGVNTVFSSDITEIRKKARGYQVTDAVGNGFYGDRVIIACGGCAGKKIGGTKSGYHLLGMLGHSCTELYPCLTQIKTDQTYVRALKGVRADSSVRLVENGRTVCASEGELQFAEFGVTGPVAFELSRAVSVSSCPQDLVIDLLRHYSPDGVLSFLQKRKTNMPDLPSEELLSGMLQARLGKTVLKRAGIPAGQTAAEISDQQLESLAVLLKYFTLPVQGVMGFDSAQVTAGGVPTSEFRSDTLESRLAPGVFACGEVLDIDGECGGFNLQWAWSSGWLAGKLGGTYDKNP